MRQSIIKIGNTFLTKIKFGKKYYLLYNNILNQGVISEKDLFFILLQISLQTTFNGYFEELYIDIYKRKNLYLREIFNNFKIAATEPTFYNKLKKICLCGRMLEKEIIFHRKILLLNFDNIIDKYFDIKDDNKKSNFIKTCEKIYNDEIASELDQSLSLNFSKPKNNSSRRVRFST